MYCEAQILDTIRYDLEQKPKFAFRLDSRNSFISARQSKILGFKIGWDYNDRVKLGIGFSYLSNGIFRDRAYVTEDGQTDTARAQLKFNYISPFFEYVFFSKGRWEHAIPVQFGFGNSRFDYYNEKGQLVRDDFRPVILYEPAMTTQFKIFSWVGLGAGVGYRLLLLNNNAIGENLNSPVYVLKVKVFFGDIYKKVIKPKSGNNP